MKKIFNVLGLFVALLACCGVASAAQEDIITVASPYISPAMKVTVVKPAGYDASGSKRYPVVYLLNGYSGNYRSWVDLCHGDLDSLATQWNMIMVCPDGRNSWYYDSPLKPQLQMESFITRSLVPAIDSLYLTIPDRAHRAITGLSMGGHGALWLAMRHSDIWGNGGSTSGGVDINPFPENWEIKNILGPREKNVERWENSSVTSLVPSLTPGQLNLIIDCGYDDFFFDINEKLHRRLLEAKIPHDYLTRPGVHNQPYWRNAIKYQLQFFNDKFNAAH